MVIDSRQSFMATSAWQIVVFYFSSFVAFIVSAMFTYSLVIYTRHITQSDSLTGLVFLLIFGPFAFFSLVGGIAADRYSRKNIILIASTMTSVLVALMAFSFDAGYVTQSNYWLLGVFAIGYGTIVPFMATARIAMVGNVLRPEILGTGTIVMSIISVLGFGLGPLVAGFIKENASWPWLFGFNSAVWLLSGLGFMLITKIHPQQTSTETSHFEDFTEGLRFIYNHKLLLQICLFMVIVAIFILGPYQTLMPEFIKQTFNFGEKQRGAFMAIFGVGLLIGGVLSTVLRSHNQRDRFLIGSTVLIGGSLALVPISSSYYPSLFFLFISGCLGGISNGLVSSIMQEESPDRVRGRVMSMYTFILIGMPALGGLLFGILAESSSLAISIMCAGLMALAISFLLSLLSKQFDMNNHIQTAVNESNSSEGNSTAMNVD